MNLCTDQLAMMIAAPGQLYSVSHLTSDPTMSLMAEEARAFRTNHGLAEEIFQMRPDLILVGAMTTRASVAMLKRLGFPVVEFPFENSFEDMRSNIRLMGEVLHRQERANELIERFDADLARLRQRPGRRRTAVLHHASSYTSGAGTLANEILEAAGYENVAANLGLSGMTKLPLEQLVLSAPDLVVTDATWEGSPALAQQTFTHPALRALEVTSARAIVANKRWVCATPHLIDLIDELSSAPLGNLASQRPDDGGKARQ
jgi:iron complex transport system substrate-binding protein